MKLIILKAGKGTRLYPLTKDRPKLLVELDGKTTLLEKQMQIFAESGVMDKVVYVVGYRTEMIEDKLAELSGRLNIATETVFNPVYDMTNNLISLWLAR